MISKAVLVGKALEEHDRRWGFIISIVFGITIFFYTVSSLIYENFNGTLDVRALPTFFVLLIGIYMIFNRNPSVLKAVGLYSIGVAVNKLPDIWKLLTYQMGDSFIGVIGEVVPILAFTVGLFLLALALNMCYTGYMYFTGRCRGYFFSLLTVVILCFLQAVDFANLFADHRSLEMYWPVYLYDISCILLYVAYMSILISDQVYRAEIKEHYRCRTNQLRAAVMSGYDGALSRKELEVIASGYVNWERDSGSNPVEFQTRFLVSYKDMDAFGTVQKWEGDEKLHFTISPTYYGFTMIEATRFDSTSIHFDTGDITTCSKVTFLDDDGSAYTFGVTDHVLEVRA